MWTWFQDMHSGGGLKEGNYSHIYIEASQAEAEIIFYNRFGHNPNRVTCTCCGEDYNTSEWESLEQVTAYERGCGYNNETHKFVEGAGDMKFQFHTYRTLEEYLKDKSVLVIRDTDIKPEERKGELPQQGYVWIN